MNIFGDAGPSIIPVKHDDPFALYDNLSRTYRYSFLLESLSEPGELAQSTVIGFDPRTVIRGYADRIEIVSGGSTRTIPADDPLGALKRMMRTSPHREHRYAGGAVGIVNYDAVRLIEEIPQSHDVVQPLFEFGLYDDGILYDNRAGTMKYFWYDTDRSGLLEKAGPEGGAFGATAPESDLDRDRFSQMVCRAKEYIHDGDIFQVVLSRRFHFGTRGNPLVLYSRLRQMNPSPYMYHVKHGDRTAIGASPEMLIRITGRRVETFPIAGTRRVAADQQETARLAQEMLHDEKERAEHTMLVDLGRNDIGRVCTPGTVSVRSLMEVKSFSHVQHMVTHVTGELDGDRDMFDAFRAIFPAGTVSGAPKVRAMEIIDELEPQARGPYAGAVGYFSYNGCCDFAIAIRSIFIDGETGTVQSGAGIVADSDPDREFQETQGKAGAMLQALGGTGR